MQLFFDPLWQMPILGSMIIGITCALISVFITLRKESLIGEALAHATYPGLAIAIIASFFFQQNQFLLLTLGGFVGAMIALWTLHFLQKSLYFSSDSSLCFVLSFFFGFGLLITSSLQVQFGSLYHLMQEFIFGSVATLTGLHIKWQSVISLIVFISLWFSYSTLKIITFDRSFGKFLGIKIARYDFLLLTLTALTIILGIPAVGIVLISGLIVTPAIAARQFSDHLQVVTVLAVCFGAFSGYLGNFLSYTVAKLAWTTQPLPTGPMILLSMSFICIVSLLFAPKRGALFRLIRRVMFNVECRREHILKTLWRKGGSLSKAQLKEAHRYASFFLWSLTRDGWVATQGHTYALTPDGFKQAARLVRLHRLWEVYLTQYLDASNARVHTHADEIEHILSGDLEERLEKIMGSSRVDPHKSIIPAKEVTW